MKEIVDKIHYIDHLIRNIIEIKTVKDVNVESLNEKEGSGEALEIFNGFRPHYIETEDFDEVDVNFLNYCRR